MRIIVLSFMCKLSTCIFFALMCYIFNNVDEANLNNVGNETSYRMFVLRRFTRLNITTARFVLKFELII